MRPRKITEIIIHCADTPDGRPQTVVDIDRWHRERGFLRSPEWKSCFNGHLTSIGYHYVIYVDGTRHSGRHPDEIGAHAVGHNSSSLGICLIGCSRFSPAQWMDLHNLVGDLLREHPNAQVLGHRDLPGVTKLCPGFPVSDWTLRGYMPAPEHTLTA